MKTHIEILGKQVHKIGIGTWMMGGGVNRDKAIVYADWDNDENNIKAIKYSLDVGQNHIDTAQLYGSGHCEEVVGEAIKGYDREKLFIASKVWKSHTKRSAVVKSAEESLRKLGTDYLDLIYIHSSNNAFEMDEYILGLNDAVDEGLAKGVAVSNFTLEQLKQAQELSKHPIMANQMLYNILERSDVTEDMLKYCVENDILLVAYRPIERRLLADQCDTEEVLDLADKYKKTPAQIALNWLLSQENVIPIPKASSPKHIDENLEALDFELSEEDIKLLSSVEHNTN